ncbi:MAG TPA: prepilin-type N-terminal cleavage/methylation domain-containing protein, partial [Candidatus Rifleibacterium sp.]|nr:prepilin-type N-terminal cleavage/methylation domain-containing protein [Candidatus Rifleibacterium sp.]
MTEKLFKRQGFTLVELLMGMSLTLLVGGVLYLMQSTGMSTVRKGTSQLLLTSEIRNKMERMVA